MAKRLIKWTVDKGVLSAEHIGLDKVQAFDIRELFPDYGQLDHAQRGIIKNGIKQRLADKTTDSQGQKLSQEEKIAWMKEQWELMTVERKYKEETAAIRGPSVSIKPLIMKLVEKGWSTKDIAEFIGKPLAIVQGIIDGD